MTKERIEKELLKVREQLAGLQARQKDLEEQLQMAEDAEKMKKALAFVLLFALVFSGCAAKKETPRLQSSTSCPPLRQVNLYDAILDHAFIFEGECLSAESVESENDMDTLLEIRVDRVFKGELEEDGMVSVRTVVPALFPKEEKLVIFADVLEETEEGVCLYSNSALYSVYDRVNYGSGIFDVGTLSYDALCERIESYMQWTPTGDESETASEEAEEESVLLILWDPSPKREIELLGDDVSVNNDWGIDHGAWTVLVHLFPDADIPVVQLSIDGEAEPADLYAMAEKLKPLRDEGVLIVGSGNVVHNLRRVEWDNPGGSKQTEAFNADVVQAVVARDDEAVIHWESNPNADYAVPTPDHFLPLIMCLGAAQDENAKVFNDVCNLGAIAMTGFVLG